MSSTRERPQRKRMTILLFLAIALVVLYVATYILSTVFAMPESAKIALTKVNVRTALKVPLDLYKRHVGHYPETLSELITPPVDAVDGAKWSGRYINSNVQIKDAWGNWLIYRFPGSHNAAGRLRMTRSDSVFSRTTRRGLARFGSRLGCIFGRRSKHPAASVIPLGSIGVLPVWA